MMLHLSVTSQYSVEIHERKKISPKKLETFCDRDLTMNGTVHEARKSPPPKPH